MGGWDASCSGLKASPPILGITGIGAQELPGWWKWKKYKQRQESMHSVTDIYLALTMCQALC